MAVFNVGDRVKLIKRHTIPIDGNQVAFATEARFTIERVDMEHQIAYVVGANNYAPLEGPYDIPYDSLALSDD